MPEQFHPITGCRTDALFGLWLIDDFVLNGLVSKAREIDFQWLAEFNVREGEKAKDKPETPLYVVDENGMAEFKVMGQTTKYPTSFQSLFGGTSTVRLQEAVRAAMKDEKVKMGLTTIESPGGASDGLWDLGADLRKFAQAKPLMARVQDKGCSGGYYLAAQCDEISCNENAQVGSIGVLSQLIDTSKKLEKDGIKVLRVRSGKTKGIGLEGVEVSPEDLKDMQRRSDDLFGLFVKSVAGPRRLTEGFVRDLEAQVFIAGEARNRSLIDHIESRESAIDRLKFNASTKTQVPVPSHGMTDPGQQQPAVTTKGSTMKDLLPKLRELSGNATLSEDEAETLMTTTFATAKGVADLQAKLTAAQANQKAQPIAPTMLEGYKKMSLKELDLAVKAGTFTDGQATHLKGLIEKNVEQLCVPAENGTSLLTDFIAAAEMAPKGVAPGTQTGVQPKVVDPAPVKPNDDFSAIDEGEKAALGHYKTDSALTAPVATAD